MKGKMVWFVKVSTQHNTILDNRSFLLFGIGLLPLTTELFISEDVMKIRTLLSGKDLRLSFLTWWRRLGLPNHLIVLSFKGFLSWVYDLESQREEESMSWLELHRLNSRNLSVGENLKTSGILIQNPDRETTKHETNVLYWDITISPRDWKGVIKVNH